MKIVRSNPLLLSMLFIFSIGSVAFTSAKASTFDEALKYANSLRDKVKIEENAVKVKNDNDKGKPSIFDPKEVFKNQKGGYTENPAQASYYQKSIEAGNAYEMKKVAITEVDKDEIDSKGNIIPTPGRVVNKAFSTREVFKITPESEYIGKSRLAKENAHNIIGGASNEHIDCKNKKTSACKTTQVEKTCNEEVRSVRRTCEKIPYVTLVDEPYPGCHRHTSPGPIEDCLAGKVQIPHYRGDGHGKITVPKNRGSRVVFDNSRHGYYYVTIKNEATGQNVVSPRTRVNNGRYIELPFSKNEDQTFSFIAHRSDGCSCQYPGSLHVYFNYIRKIPNVEWREESCRDI